MYHVLFFIKCFLAKSAENAKLNAFPQSLVFKSDTDAETLGTKVQSGGQVILVDKGHRSADNEVEFYQN